jgi:hypothetical protein
VRAAAKRRTGMVMSPNEMKPFQTVEAMDKSLLMCS